MSLIMIHAPANSEKHRVVLGINVQSHIFQCFYHGNSGVKPFDSLQEPAVQPSMACCSFGPYLKCLPSLCIEGAIIIQDVDERKVVPLADFIMQRIMSRPDCDSPGAKIHIDHVIRDDWKAPLNERMSCIFASEMLRQFSTK
jgi:hypothetical protein